jgi:hypothetical protein
MPLRKPAPWYSRRPLDLVGGIKTDEGFAEAGLAPAMRRGIGFVNTYNSSRAYKEPVTYGFFKSVKKKP